MSFNYHRDHFGTVWNLRNADGEVAHTGCVAFGIDRLALALFATHGARFVGLAGGRAQSAGSLTPSSVFCSNVKRSLSEAVSGDVPAGRADRKTGG